jgi:hypothetical protein
MVSLQLFIEHNPFGHTIAGVDSTSNSTDYQEYFPWSVCGRGVGLKKVPIALKSGSFNLLVLSGPVQACNGTALQCIIMNKHLIIF